MRSIIAKPFVLVLLPGGRATLRARGENASMPWGDCRELAAGDETAIRAAAELLAPGAWEIPTCITPNGRLDQHFKYMKGSACMFCGVPFQKPGLAATAAPRFSR